MLLAVPIRDDEIFELLERLAATEEMFKAPVSTIRDVAELTEASPNLIARVLGEMRGPGEFEKLVSRVDNHDRLIQDLNSKLHTLSNGGSQPATNEINLEPTIPRGLANFLAFLQRRGERINVKVVFVIVLIIVTAFATVPYFGFR